MLQGRPANALLPNNGNLDRCGSSHAGLQLRGREEHRPEHDRHRAPDDAPRDPGLARPRVLGDEPRGGPVGRGQRGRLAQCDLGVRGEEQDQRDRERVEGVWNDGGVREEGRLRVRCWARAACEQWPGEHVRKRAGFDMQYAEGEQCGEDRCGEEDVWGLRGSPVT